MISNIYNFLFNLNAFLENRNDFSNFKTHWEIPEQFNINVKDAAIRCRTDLMIVTGFH